MQNFSLLKRAGRAGKPVLLKRGMSATLEEFLMAAEYIMSEGNYNVILCERGVRTFADHTRNTLDLSIVPAVQRLSHLPILVDPSHGTGKRNKVTPLARAAVDLSVELWSRRFIPERPVSEAVTALMLADRDPDPLGGGGHIDVVDPVFTPQPLDDGVHHCRTRADRPGLARALDAQRIGRAGDVVGLEHE